MCAEKICSMIKHSTLEKKHFSFCEVSSQYTRTPSMASITLVLKTSLPANKEDK